MLQLIDTAPLIDALLLGVNDEVYILDILSLQLVYVSESVLADTGYHHEDLKSHTIEALLGVNKDVLLEYVESHRHHSYFVEILQNTTPIIGNINHNKLRLMVFQSGKNELIIAVKKENFDSDSNNKISGISNTSDYQTQCQTMVTNTPGMVFQFQLGTNGEIKFINLTDGCKALLGLNAEDLKCDSDLLYSMMNARDRASLRKCLELSTTNLSLMNWEGKVWIDGWQDNKWLDMRAVPRLLPNGVVQWEGIMTNITQSKNAKHELEKSRRELIELTAHIHKIKEQERSAIAREIHDDLGGNLTAIKMGLTSIIKRLTAGQTVPVEQAQGLKTILDSTFEAVHRISSDLRPNVLDLGIVAAIEWQANEFQKQLPITCTFTCNQSEIPVTTDQGITLFRIFQESLSNITKHANATHVDVDLMAEPNEILLTISDNGVGIKSSDTLKADSFGLRGMRERVTALHGTFKVMQSSKQGTIISIRLPSE